MEFQSKRVFRTFIVGSLKHSQVGNLEQEAWLGSLEARHAASFLWAVPESNISHTTNVQDIVIFLTSYLNVWTLQIYNAPKNPALCCGAHVRWCSRDRICLEGKFTELHLSLIGKCNIEYSSTSKTFAQIWTLCAKFSTWKQWILVPEPRTIKLALNRHLLSTSLIPKAFIRPSNLYHLEDMGLRSIPGA